MTARSNAAAIVDAEIARAKDDGVVLVQASTLTPVPVSWLWPGWLARGKLHICAGSAGQGKTTLALALAATVTGGGRFPDGSRGERGNVLIWSGEDDATDTLLPRLIGMGADLTRVHFIDGTRAGGKVEAFDPSRDMVQLAEQATRIGSIQLLIVDPVVSAVAGDSHKNTEVRRALQPLVDLGSALGCAVLGITHFSKGSSGRDPVERVTGSIAFGAVARVVMCAAKVRGEGEDQDRRILARSKSNIGPDGGGFEYSIVQAPLAKHPEIIASTIEWGRPVEGTALELLAEAEADQSEEKSALDSAEDFLRQLLSAGSAPSKSVESNAKEAGHALRTVRRAADALRVSRKKGSDGWYWSLPMRPVKLSTRNLGHVGQLGQLGQDDRAVVDWLQERSAKKANLSKEANLSNISNGHVPDPTIETEAL